MWWLPLAEFLGKIALKLGVSFLESRYPGIKPILEKIVEWLSGHAEQGTAQAAIQALDTHIDKLI